MAVRAHLLAYLTLARMGLNTDHIGYSTLDLRCMKHRSYRLQYAKSKVAGRAHILVYLTLARKGGNTDHIGYSTLKLR